MYLSCYLVTVNFDQSVYGVMESDNMVSLRILLSQPSSLPFQVVINTIDVTAESNTCYMLINLAITLCSADIDDYSGGMITVNVSSGVLSQSFRLTIHEDNIVECSETFNVTIASISSCGITVGTNDNIEVIITDNDSKQIIQYFIITVTNHLTI